MRHHDKYLAAGFLCGAIISDQTKLVFETYFSANILKPQLSRLRVSIGIWSLIMLTSVCRFAICDQCFLSRAVGREDSRFSTSST